MQCSEIIFNPFSPRVRNLFWLPLSLSLPSRGPYYNLIGQRLIKRYVETLLVLTPVKSFWVLRYFICCCICWSGTPSYIYAFSDIKGRIMNYKRLFIDMDKYYLSSGANCSIIKWFIFLFENYQILLKSKCAMVYFCWFVFVCVVYLLIYE